ncbi:MAG: UDP-glucose 4-epimerase GalE [Planctomycetota bacterium]|nr:MAG: UDP-glucose 4-epimerase GalE [Planctomycetota bacterium]
MKVLVTGGCGYIGSATARLLRRRGHEVEVLDNLSEGHRAAWDGPFTELELLDRDALHGWLQAKQFDGLIHFAARAYVGESVLQPERYWRSNVVPLIHLTEALEGVPIVFSSTCAVYGEPPVDRLDETLPKAPINPYGATKAAAERLLSDRDGAGHGKYAALRYFNAAGAEEDGSHGEDHDPETHLIPLAVHAALGLGKALTVFGNDWPTPDGTCVRDYIHILDLAEAHLCALERLWQGGDSGQWNVGTGRGASVLEVIQAVEKAAGRPVPWSPGPRRAGDPPFLVANADKAAKDLGWKAQWTDLDALVATAVAWHQSHPAGYSS